MQLALFLVCSLARIACALDLVDLVGNPDPWLVTNFNFTSDAQALDLGGALCGEASNSFFLCQSNARECTLSVSIPFSPASDVIGVAVQGTWMVASATWPFEAASFATVTLTAEGPNASAVVMEQLVLSDIGNETSPMGREFSHFTNLSTFLRENSSANSLSLRVSVPLKEKTVFGIRSLKLVSVVRGDLIREFTNQKRLITCLDSIDAPSAVALHVAKRISRGFASQGSSFSFSSMDPQIRYREVKSGVVLGLFSYYNNERGIVLYHQSLEYNFTHRCEMNYSGRCQSQVVQFFGDDVQFTYSLSMAVPPTFSPSHAPTFSPTDRPTFAPIQPVIAAPIQSSEAPTSVSKSLTQTLADVLPILSPLLALAIIAILVGILLGYLYREKEAQKDLTFFII